MRVPATLSEMETLFRKTHAEEEAFVKQVDEEQFSRVLDFPWIPEARPRVADAMMQVVMHSQHHRGQCASRLRALGGAPPMVDFILWLKHRPAAA